MQQIGHQQPGALGAMVIAYGPDSKEWTFGKFLSNFPVQGGPAQPDSRASILVAARNLPPPPMSAGADDADNAEVKAASAEVRSKSFIARGVYETDDDIGRLTTDEGLEIYVSHQPDFEHGESVWMTAMAGDVKDGAVFAFAISVRADAPNNAPDYGDGHRAGQLRSRVAARLAELCDWPDNPSIAQAVITAHLAPERLTAADREQALGYLAPHAASTLDDYLGRFVGGFIDGLNKAMTLAPPITDERPARMPARRLLKSARDAEEYAAEVMIALGFSDARATSVGPDGGIDVTASGAVAQVKMEAIPTGRPAVQRIAGVASSNGLDALFFSLAGYTDQAVDWAEAANVALFEFAFDGTVEPRSRGAERRLTSRHPAPAAWHVDPLERFEHRWWDGKTWTENVATQGVPDTDPLE